MTTVNERAINPFPWYRAMRETQPVYYREEFGMWQIFRYDDVQRVLTDYESFSSQSITGDHLLSSSLINIDPPRHRQLRSLVTQAFTPRTVAQLAPRITEIMHGLLDQVVEKGEMDIIDDLAYPLPVIVIAEMLGVSTQDRERFRHWSALVAGTEDGGGEDYQQEMSEYFMALLEERRHEPKDDLLSALLAARVDGQSLTQEELLSFCVLLLVAGNVTTTNLIGNAFVAFNEWPDALQALYTDHSLVPSVIEEVLRYRSPVSRQFRICVRDVKLADQQIGAGSFVSALIGSANRDPDAFSDPDVFDVRRASNRHIAFGHGIHFCLGAPLARLEAKITLEIMLERLQEIRMVSDVQLEAVSNIILHGFKHVPITFKHR